MPQQRIAKAIGRIELALGQLEKVDMSNFQTAHSDLISAKYDALRQTTHDVLTDLDDLLLKMDTDHG